MDFVLLCIAFIAIVIIIIVYMLGQVKYTSNVKTLLDYIVSIRPLTTSFSLGADPKDPTKYLNVTINQDGSPNITSNEYPIDGRSKFIIANNHGTILPLKDGDGFTITGIDSTTFLCPNGYTGSECFLAPLCVEPNDAGTLKPLTYAQFNGLRLYQNAFASKPLPMLMDDLEIIRHPRIRVNCLTSDGEYELQTCPDNTLLDNDLKCVSYDICQDRINGYKHNYPIKPNQPNLDPNEYYICQNNASELKICDSGTLFSHTLHGCITNSACFGLGMTRLKMNDTSYIQCEHDRGTIVTCENGLNEDHDNISCITKDCVPKLFQYKGTILEYTYGEVTCNERDEATTIRCNNAESVRDFNYEWAEPFKFSIPTWPTEIYVNGECVKPTDDIMAHPVVPLRWSEAMSTTHPFNLRTEKYICDDPATKYRWDYKNPSVEPMPSNDLDIVNSGAPCQTGLVSKTLIRYPVQGYPETKLPCYILLEESVLVARHAKQFWPQYEESTKEFTHRYVENDTVALSIVTQTSKTMPLGFIFPSDVDIPSTTNPINLKLAGYSAFEPKLNNQYYTIASGNVDHVHMFDPTTNILSFKFRQSVRTDEAIEFAIDFTKIQPNTEILPKLIFNPDTIVYNGNVIDITYTTFSILYYEGDAQSTFQMDDGTPFKISFNIADYPTLTFYN